MKKSKITKEELDKLEKEFRASLLSDKAKYAKYGINLGKLWKGLLASEKTVGKK